MINRTKSSGLTFLPASANTTFTDISALPYWYTLSSAYYLETQLLHHYKLIWGLAFNKEAAVIRWKECYLMKWAAYILPSHHILGIFKIIIYLKIMFYKVVWRECFVSSISFCFVFCFGNHEIIFISMFLWLCL